MSAVGRPWAAPVRGRRAGVDGALTFEEWMAVYPVGPDGAVPSAGAGPSAGDGETGDGQALDPRRVKRWVSHVAYLSPLNAPWLLSAGEPEEAFRRWRRLAEGTVPHAPCLLRLPSGWQPYPWPLGDAIPTTPVASLLAGMDVVVTGTDAVVAGTDPAAGAQAEADVDPTRGETGQAGAVLDRRGWALDRERGRVERKLAALRRQAAKTREAARLREDATLVLSSLGQIKPGADRVELAGFDGAPRTLKLDPAMRPQENAAAWFRLAARMERGAAKLAHRIRDAEAEVERLDRAARLHALGKLPPEELEAALPAAPAPSGRRADLPTLPYRRYRTSGGLEVRVGRGARQNDALTFHHSRPNDVWLHARHAGGAHVVLRWVRAERPPAADLAEAATLAANHSAARSSSHVPVDWTRRKWVRKPRGTPPGLVTPDRVQTVFVSPDPEVEEPLRYRADAKA